MSRIRLIRCTTIGLLLVGPVTFLGVAQASPKGGEFDPDTMGAGLGAGVATRTTTGERLDTTRRQGMTLDYDFESTGTFGFISGDYLAGTGHGNDWDLRLAVGMGWRYAKLGIGMLSRGGEYPVSPGTGRINFQATGFTFYTRLHPLDTRYLSASIDSYAGRYTTGKTSTCYCGGYVYESVNAGDGYGYSVRILLKLPPNTHGAVSLNYGVDRVDFDAGVLNMPVATRIMSRQATIEYHWTSK